LPSSDLRLPDVCVDKKVPKNGHYCNQRTCCSLSKFRVLARMGEYAYI